MKKGRYSAWSGTPSRLRSVPRCQSQMPNYLLALKWPPPSLPHPCILADNADADGNIIAVRPPTPPLSSSSSECLEFYPWNTMAVDRPSPLLLPLPAPLSSGLFKEWSATQQLFTALLFRQNRFSNSPFFLLRTDIALRKPHSLPPPALRGVKFVSGKS